MRIRVALSLLAIMMALYFAVRGAMSTGPRAQPALDVVAIGVFLLSVAAALIASHRAPVGGPPKPLPRWATLVSCGGALALPMLATAGQAPGDDLAMPDSTWYIGAGGVVFTIVCVRRRPVAAWVGTAAFSILTMVVLGSVQSAFVAGLLGSLVWVGAAQLVILFTDQAYRDTARLAVIQQESASWRRAQEARRRERRERVQVAIAVAGPVLTRVIEAGGALTDAERDDAIVAEATLRDELRGAKLLDGSVRAALAERRRAGSTVTLFDEGGIDDLSGAALEEVRGELARVLRATSAEHLIVRTSRLSETAVTVVGRGAGDEVELWSEIRRPREDPGRRARPGS